MFISSLYRLFAISSCVCVRLSAVNLFQRICYSKRGTILLSSLDFSVYREEFLGNVCLAESIKTLFLQC